MGKFQPGRLRKSGDFKGLTTEPQVGIGNLSAKDWTAVDHGHWRATRGGATTTGPDATPPPSYLSKLAGRGWVGGGSWGGGGGGVLAAWRGGGGAARNVCDNSDILSLLGRKS